MSGSLKNILVKVAGKGLENAEAEKVVLAPGTKVKDVIAQLGLQNFRRMLAHGPGVFFQTGGR